jgi:hypothetical protein
MSVVGRLDQYASTLAWEFDETTANNPSITGFGTYYASEFSENIGITTALIANVFPPYDPVYDEFVGVLYGPGQGIYMRQNTDKSAIVYNEIDEVTTDFYGRGIIRNGLILDLDAGKTDSYSGSGTTWYDLSSSGNNGTLTDGPTYSSANGGSLVFSSASYNYVDIFGSTTVSEATFSVWLKRNGSQGSYAGILFTRGGSSFSVSGLDFNMMNNTLGYHWNNDPGSYDFDSELTPPDGVWCMCVVTVTSTVAKFYLCQSSGITTATNTLGHSSTTLDGLKLGWDGEGDRYMDGNIAVAQIYNRALSAEEVSQNFNALKGRFGL